MIKSHISEVYPLISDFLVESLKDNKNQKNISIILQFSFSQKTSLILRTSAHSILQKIYSRNTTKNVSHWCQKKHSHCTIFRRPKTVFLEHFESKYLYIPVNLCSKILFQRRRKLLSGFYLGGGTVGGLNNSLLADRCLGLVQCFKNFQFN